MYICNSSSNIDLLCCSLQAAHGYVEKDFPRVEGTIFLDIFFLIYFCHKKWIVEVCLE